MTGTEACSDCLAGTFTSFATSFINCIACQPGFFQSLSAQSSCKQCPGGWYQALFGATECRLCPVGTYSAVGGSLECTVCPAGTEPASSEEGAGFCGRALLSREVQNRQRVGAVQGMPHRQIYKPVNAVFVLCRVRDRKAAATSGQRRVRKLLCGYF